MKKFALFAAMSLMATTAQAQEVQLSQADATAIDFSAEAPFEGKDKAGKDRTGVTLRPSASTLGLGGEVGYRLNDRFGLRAPFGSGEASFDGDYDGYDVTGDANIGGLGILVDFFPGKGAFHVSGGAFKTDYSLTGVARDVNVNGYTTDVMLDVYQKRDIAPVIAFGWDFQIGKHGSLSADLGAVFGSGFNVNASESSGLAPQSEVDAEMKEFRDAAADLKVLPYFKFGLGFKF